MYYYNTQIKPNPKLIWRTANSVFVVNKLCSLDNYRIYLIICSSIPYLGSDLTTTKPPSIQSLNTIISFLWFPEGHRGHTIWVSLEKNKKRINDNIQNKTYTFDKEVKWELFFLINWAKYTMYEAFIPSYSSQ